MKKLLILFVLSLNSYLFAQYEYIYWKGDYVQGGVKAERMMEQQMQDSFAKEDSFDRLNRVPFSLEEPLNPELGWMNEVCGTFYGQIQLLSLERDDNPTSGAYRWASVAYFDKIGEDIIAFLCGIEEAPKHSRGAGVFLWKPEDSIAGNKVRGKELKELYVKTEKLSQSTMRCVVQVGEKFYITKSKDLEIASKVSISLDTTDWYEYFPDENGSIDVRDRNVTLGKKVLGEKTQLPANEFVDSVGIYFDTADGDNAKVAFQEMVIITI